VTDQDLQQLIFDSRQIALPRRQPSLCACKIDIDLADAKNDPFFRSRWSWIDEGQRATGEQLANSKRLIYESSAPASSAEILSCSRERTDNTRIGKSLFHWRTYG